MLTKHDIAMMTDGQREILYVGMKMERDKMVEFMKGLDPKTQVKDLLFMLDGNKNEEEK